ERANPAGISVQPARRQERMQEPEAERGLDRSRPQVALDPIEDGLEPDELAGRVKVEEAVDQPGASLDRGEPIGQPGPDGRVIRRDRPSPFEIRSVEARIALGSSALAPAHRT